MITQDNTQTEAYSIFKDALEKAIESQVEYLETHDDALDAYAHLPSEGGWDYNNCDEKLKEFLSDNDIDHSGSNSISISQDSSNSSKYSNKANNPALENESGRMALN